jgi:L-lactate dehydrogenase complex protein LldE
MTAQPRRVALFVTCIVDQIYPRHWLRRCRTARTSGVEVHVPRGLTCCGQMAFNAGFRDDAYAVAGRTIEILRNQGDVVLPSGSCGAMIRHLYHELFHGTRHAAAAKELASRTYELSEYLVDVLGVTDVGARYDGVIAFHDACHGMRYMGLGRQARTLLDHVAGARIVALPGSDECCGFGGLFAVKQHQISAAMLHRKLTHITECGCDLVVTGGRKLYDTDRWRSQSVEITGASVSPRRSAGKSGKGLGVRIATREAYRYVVTDDCFR